MSDNGKLQRTALYDLHKELDGRMVEFAGYEMPVRFTAGVMQEHQHTREHAGLFDVSHMGQVRLSGPDTAAALETVVPGDIVGLEAGQQRYTVFTNEHGGILDDLVVTNAGDYLFLVLNAACKARDIEHLRTALGRRCSIDVLEDCALLALQGPAAHTVLERIAPEATALTFMTAAHFDVAGARCLVSRSGYTGEDGFEISIPAPQAETLARELLAHEAVAPIGLGARDSLRLEAGLCLYGHDLNTGTTPVEASLKFVVAKARRAGGERQGGYPGADVVMRQFEEGVNRRRVGLLAAARTPVREGAELVDTKDQTVGVVTSGTYGPTVGAPVAMGYVSSGLHKTDTELSAMVRGRAVPVKVAKTPFVPPRQHRG